MKIYLYLIAAFSIFLSCNQQKTSEDNLMLTPELDKLAIGISAEFSRPFVFTNREAAFFYGESSDLRRNAHQGFYVNTHRYLDDYILKSGRIILERKNAKTVTVYPDRMNRVFHQGITENTYLIDNQNCLVVELSSQETRTYEFIPLLPSSFDISNKQVKWLKSEDLLLIIPPAINEDDSKPDVLGIKFDCDTEFNSDIKDTVTSLIPANQIGQFIFSSNRCQIFIIVGESEKDVKKTSRDLQKNVSDFINKKKQRLSKLITENYVETNIAEFNQAFQWALISMDQLIMKQSGAGKEVTGIFAGLPWFNNYWGRDTFISFPGAALVTGRLNEAREILLSFAQFQNKNENDTNYGRIPNQVTTDNIIYNTADATPWFVRELWEYYLYSGDFELLKSLFEVVKLSINGTLKYHVDENSFLTHDDAETWMDAKGTDGPWSPRGNRAVDIQVLWYQQLNAGINIAALLGDSTHADKWKTITSDLEKNFIKKFWNTKRMSLYDHLNADGSPDHRIRPNQIFAITIPESPLITPQQELAVLREVVTKLTYPYGVASLWQHDPDFHPFHLHPQAYPKDEAYHNGTVWGWLAGPVISSLMKYGYKNLGFELLFSESYQVVHWGAAGTLSELLNAIPPQGWDVPEPSGTVSQAWSLAEYIRNVYQDLIGIRPNVPEKTIQISPQIPDAIEYLICRIPVPESDLELNIQQSETDCIYKLNYSKGNHPWKIEFEFPVSAIDKLCFSHEMQVKDTLEIGITLNGPKKVIVNGKPIEAVFKKIAIEESLIRYLSFAVPQLDRNLNYLKPPPYPLLTGKQIKMWNPKAAVLIDKNLPEFDDKGPDGKYSYPNSSHFKDGIFDLTKFQLFEDDNNYYFRLRLRELVQPGWHPEYGFQLTFIAIALNQGLKEAGATFVHRNANQALPEKFSFHKILFIGGWLQLEDSDGKILLAHRPQDIHYALGDIHKKEISFALPKKYLGAYPEKWKLAIMVGGQDDHGGGGIGEFRNVAKEASSWQGGGGKLDKGNNNVYDFVLIDK